MELKLTLHKKAFEVMVTGEKPDEFRADSEWIRSRLRYPNGDKKEYDTVLLTNGYGSTRPYYRAKFISAAFVNVQRREYSNGLIVPNDNYWHIKLGEIIEKGNLK